MIQMDATFLLKVTQEVRQRSSMCFEHQRISKNVEFKELLQCVFLKFVLLQWAAKPDLDINPPQSSTITLLMALSPLLFWWVGAQDTGKLDFEGIRTRALNGELGLKFTTWGKVP